MPLPALDADERAWARVGARIRQRRTELDLNQEELGVSKAVASAIENARQGSFSRRTLTRICRALEWTPDSIDRILAGGEPLGIHLEPTGDADVIVMIAELKDRIAALEERVGIRRQLDQAEIDERAARNKARRAAKRTAAAAQPQ